MNVTGKIEVAGDCAYYRPAGKVTLEQAAELVDQAIVFARDRRIPKLLINCTQLTGFPSPTLPQRYFMVRGWAKTAQGLVQLAMVVRPELIDPEKFGITVAHNAGLTGGRLPDGAGSAGLVAASPDGETPARCA